jgi:cytoskeleton protein RodZ
MSEHERAESPAVSPNQVAGSPAEAVAREIGASLAREREAQGLSLGDVSARLKVAGNKLAAIEAGRIDALPDLTFAKGVMRAYARMLHADIDGLLARFHAQAVPVVDVGIRRQGSLNESFDDRARFRSGSSFRASGSGGSGGRWIWLALVAAVVCAGALFGIDHIKQWIDAQRDGFATSAPAGEAAAPAGESGTVVAPLPQVMGGADASAPSESPAMGAAGATGATGTTETPLPAPLAASAPAGAIASGASAPMAATAAAPAAAPAGGGDVRLRFVAETWYEVRDSSGKVVIGGTAKPGEEVAGTGTPPYKVVIGNVKGVESMTRGGAPVDVQAANRNNVARLTLP